MSAHCRSFWTDKLWSAAFPGWDTEIKICNGRLTTVPKNSKTDRCIVIEPGLTTFLQLGLGGYLKARLKVFGLDLSHGQEKHRSIVLQASKDCELATVDLSAASDSVTKQLVILLLPFEWWSLLDDLRVKTTLVDGQIHVLEMFSSMGNGFTFELESLLFYAITRVVCRLNGFRGRISVYGAVS